MSENDMAVVSNEGGLTAAKIVIGVNTDVSKLTLQEKDMLFRRFSEAQAADKIDDVHIGKELTATDLTVFQREYLDPDTGMMGLATYVTFILADGSTIKTSSSQGIPFALSVARFIGYDPKSGHLPNPIKFEIRLSKAETGFKYNFVYKGLA